MTCREAQKLVMPYINKEISDEDLAEFLKHIDSCEECREELEILFYGGRGNPAAGGRHRHL